MKYFDLSQKKHFKQNKDVLYNQPLRKSNLISLFPLVEETSIRVGRTIARNSLSSMINSKPNFLPITLYLLLVNYIHEKHNCFRRKRDSFLDNHMLC